MSQSIKKYRNNDELIKDLEERKLFFPDNESKKIFKIYLIQYGYFSFIKKMSNNLMYEDIQEKIYKKEFTSNNLRYLFDIDRNNSTVIFKYFRNIEFLLNSSLLKVISKKINKEANCPYIAALNNESIENIFPLLDEKMPKSKKQENGTLVAFHNDLFKNFINIDFDCVEAIDQNKTEENNETKILIEKGWFKEHVDLKTKNNFLKNWEYLDIFSLFQILTFSQLKRIFSYLSISLKNEVIKEFFRNFKSSDKYLKLKEIEFSYLIDMFSKLRNVLMHNGCIMKFSITIPENIKDTFEKYFNIEIPSPEIKLNEIIIIMESIINIKDKIFEEIYQLISFKFKNRTNRSDKISDLIFDIIENESRIKIDKTILI